MEGKGAKVLINDDICWPVHLPFVDGAVFSVEQICAEGPLQNSKRRTEHVFFYSHMAGTEPCCESDWFGCIPCAELSWGAA